MFNKNGTREKRQEGEACATTNERQRGSSLFPLLRLAARLISSESALF